jgi:RNA polymerase sigma factor (sigma-70 family)
MPPPAEGFAARLVLGPALRTQPDRRLVALVRDGYETAFEEIVRRYGRPLTRYAAAIVGSRGEDVTQDAFSKALLALRRTDAEIELRPWLFRIVRNTALNELRDRPPSPEALAEAIAGGADPAEVLERREELADLMRRLRSLPEPQRAAIVMRELEGLSHEEIAAALGLSGGAARQAIYRARQALRDGIGLLLPLPLLRVLADHGGEVAVAGAGAGGVAAGGALGGAALKAGVVTAVLAGSVGTGIALQERDSGDPETTRAAQAAPATAAGIAAAAAGPATLGADPTPATAAVEPANRASGPSGKGGGDAVPAGQGDDRREDQQEHGSSGRGRGDRGVEHGRGRHRHRGPGPRGGDDSRSGPGVRPKGDRSAHRGGPGRGDGPGHGENIGHGTVTGHDDDSARRDESGQGDDSGRSGPADGDAPPPPPDAEGDAEGDSSGSGGAGPTGRSGSSGPGEGSP